MNHDDYSDFYMDVFNNPAKHMQDLKDAVQAGRRDIFDAMLDKIDDHPEAACVAYLKHGLSWSSQLPFLHPHDNYISYIDLLLADALEILKGNTARVSYTSDELISHAFEVWNTTPSAMEYYSLFFEIYPHLSTEQQHVVRTFAQEHFSVLHLLKAAMSCGAFELVQTAMDQSQEILFPQQIIEHLLATNLEHLGEVWKRLPQTREQSFYVINHLQPKDPNKVMAMKRLIQLYGEELKAEYGNDWNYHLSSAIDSQHNDLARVLTFFYNPEPTVGGFCLLTAAGFSVNSANPEMFDVLCSMTPLEQVQKVFDILNEEDKTKCPLLAQYLDDQNLNLTLRDTLLSQRESKQPGLKGNTRKI